MISLSKRPSLGGLQRQLLAAGAEGVEVLAGEVPLVGDELGRDALGHQAALALRSATRPWRPNGKLPGVTDAPIGVVDMTSMPAAMTTS